MIFCPPDRCCSKCPRLADFRARNKCNFPSYHNGPVEAFGALSAEVLVVGLAPGLNGANQTNRPFTNDYAGDVLYPILKKNGLAVGEYQKRRDDGFELVNVRVTNTVRCVPPQNKPIGEEIKNCSAFLKDEITAMPSLKIILALGVVAHQAVLRVLGEKVSALPFKHGAFYKLSKSGLILVDSYHTSRYNINTGVLTYEMFDFVVKCIVRELQKNG